MVLEGFPCLGGLGPGLGPGLGLGLLFPDIGVRTSEREGECGCQSPQEVTGSELAVGSWMR